MRGSAHTLRPAALAALALVGCLVVAAPGTAAKRKGGGKKGGGTVEMTKVVNLPVPDAGPGAAGLDGILTSTIEVSQKSKGKLIRDVNATVQTLGTSGTAPVDDINARLVAPSGAHAYLYIDLDGFSPATALSLGPLTLDDEALLALGDGTPDNATALYAPWLGTAAPNQPLFPLDGGPVSGTWRLDVIDDTPGGTSNLVIWGLKVTTGRPFKTK